MKWRRIVFGFLLAGCTTWPEQESSRLDEPRIIGVVAEPPEQRPGEAVTFRVHAADESGRLSTFEVRGTFCLTPKPLTENNSVSEACLGEIGRPLSGGSPDFSGEVPSEACSLFGPEPPPGDGRPRDPDETYGYYAPLRWDAFGGKSIFLERIRCNPQNASLEASLDYLTRYLPNENPSSLRLELAEAAGEKSVRAFLPDSDAETFVKIEVNSGAVVEARETLAGTWFVSRGSLEGDDGVFSRVAGGWATTVAVHPDDEAAPATVSLFVRDSRGGTAFGSLLVE